MRKVYEVHVSTNYEGTGFENHSLGCFTNFDKAKTAWKKAVDEEMVAIKEKGYDFVDEDRNDDCADYVRNFDPANCVFEFYRNGCYEEEFCRMEVFAIDLTD